MAVVSLQLHENIPALEFNHRTYADIHDLPFARFRVRDAYEKYLRIYDWLQRHPGGTALFIDSNSYFVDATFVPPNVETALVQARDGVILDNVIQIRSCPAALRLIKRILEEAAAHRFAPRQLRFLPTFPADTLCDYPLEKDGVYFNVDIALHAGATTMSNIFVAHTDCPVETQNVSLAEILCNHRKNNYQVSPEPLSIVNPGRPRALVTLYTAEIAEQGAIAEENLARHCRKNDLTLYVHRENPQADRGIAATWLKPYLLLDILPNHEYAAWVDSDVLASPAFEFDFSGDLRLYNDPAAWFFNAGVMVFRQTEKNLSLLREVVRRCETLPDRSTTYASEGDQRQFNEVVREFYPDYLPESSLRTNRWFGLGDPDPSETGYLMHFMGIPATIRADVMDFYHSRMPHAPHAQGVPTAANNNR